MHRKYSDLLADWLVDLGYTHCFYLSGGNIMHFQESARTRFKCIPVIHEVAAGIASEYFNSLSINQKAFALVTAGPGLTNIVTAIGGAYLESRNVLIIGGQVKREDLSKGRVVQKGIQEIDGLSIVKPITKRAVRLDSKINFKKFAKFIQFNENEKGGPIYIEIPLDIQGEPISKKNILNLSKKNFLKEKKINKKYYKKAKFIVDKLNKSFRPSILLGAGISRQTSLELKEKIKKLNLPIMTTWNGCDRIDSRNKNYFGRPNTWGQRYSNLIIQQSDLLLALGTRLGLQQTGFNWKEFVPKGEIIQVDIDKRELQKGHPKTKYPLNLDVNILIKEILNLKINSKNNWIKYCNTIKNYFPLEDKKNLTRKNYVSPYEFYNILSKITKTKDLIVPCSSGGASTTFYQSFNQKIGQKIINNKGLASMGYGLSGAIGASFSDRNKRVIHIEGDGGLTQNIQEFGTVAINKLNIKTFIFYDNGYASIRMTQKNYFNGAYMGCDTKTLLGIPKWDMIFKSWGLKTFFLKQNFQNSKVFNKNFNSKEPVIFIVPIDPEQTYYPKISSRVTEDGSMESNPLHNMTPSLTNIERQKFLKFI